MAQFGDMVIGTDKVARRVGGQLVSADGVKGVVVYANEENIGIIWEDNLAVYWADKEDYMLTFNQAQCLDCQTIGQKNRIEI